MTPAEGKGDIVRRNRRIQRFQTAVADLFLVRVGAAGASTVAHASCCERHDEGQTAARQLHLQTRASAVAGGCGTKTRKRPPASAGTLDRTGASRCPVRVRTTLRATPKGHATSVVPPRNARMGSGHALPAPHPPPPEGAPTHAPDSRHSRVGRRSHCRRRWSVTCRARSFGHPSKRLASVAGGLVLQSRGEQFHPIFFLPNTIPSAQHRKNQISVVQMFDVSWLSDNRGDGGSQRRSSASCTPRCW